MSTIEDFKIFLTTAPANWDHKAPLKRFQLPNGEFVSCILWNELFHMTGTDIVRSVAFRFEAMGRKIVHQKKFEEGIFSDLRNLKPGVDATLEEPRSPFLRFLYENQCIRTQKKQKVFYWFSVQHDKLLLDALERDLKREAAGQPPCTVSNFPSLPATEALEQAKRHCLPSMPNAISEMSQLSHVIKSSPDMVNMNSNSYYHSPQLSHRGSPPQTVQMSNEYEQYQLFENGQMYPKPDQRGSQFTCPYAKCGREFKRSEHLRRHIRSHTGEKPYVCPHGCGRSFARSDHLRLHVKSHNQEEPFATPPLQWQPSNDLLQLPSLQYDYYQVARNDPKPGETVDSLMENLLQIDADLNRTLGTNFNQNGSNFDQSSLLTY